MPEASPHWRVACFKSVFLQPYETFIAEQLGALERYEPLVLTLNTPDLMGLPESAVKSVSNLSPLSRALNRLSFGLTGGLPYFESQVRQEECRVLHALSGSEGPWAARLRARLGRPLVTTFLGSDIVRLTERKSRPYARLFAEGDLFLASAEIVRKHLLAAGCPEERVRVHHVGVDLDRIPFSEREPTEGQPVNVLVVGRLVERKGIPYALRAFSAVRRYQRNIALTLVGDGPDRPAIEALLRELSLDDVRLLGAQPRAAVLGEMQRAHIYVQASVTTTSGDTEGIPLALVEAQASGLPVVATWHGGIPEVVADGRSGFLVSERNSHALAERLRHLIEHPELWGPFGRAGRTVAEERFNLRRQVRALEACYDELSGTEGG